MLLRSTILLKDLTIAGADAVYHIKVLGYQG